MGQTHSTTQVGALTGQGHSTAPTQVNALTEQNQHSTIPTTMIIMTWGMLDRQPMMYMCEKCQECHNNVETTTLDCMNTIALYVVQIKI